MPLELEYCSQVSSDAMRKMIKGQQTRQISAMPVQRSTHLPLLVVLSSRHLLIAAYFVACTRTSRARLCSLVGADAMEYSFFLRSGLFENRVDVTSTLRLSSCNCCTRLSLCNNSRMLEVFGTGVADFHCVTVSTSVTTSASRTIYLGVLVGAAQSCLRPRC